MSNVYQEYSKLVKDFIYNSKNFSISKNDIFGKDFQKLYEEYAIWGGYPEVLKATDEETKEMIIKNIYETYISRDIIELLKITNYSKLKRLLSLLAIQTGSLVNYNNLANENRSYFKEIKHYTSILEETFVVYFLKPFFANKTSELRKNPKTYFIDLGLRNYIISNFNDLRLRNDTGQVIENVVFNQLNMRQQENASIKYWRTIGGAEVDFIIDKQDNLFPIEVKYSLLKHNQVSRGFRSFICEYKPKQGVVFTKNFWGEIKIGVSLIKFIPVWYL